MVENRNLLGAAGNEIDLAPRNYPALHCDFRRNSMSDPVTIGVLTASALAMAAEAVVKIAVGEAVKDAYKALKDKVAVWIGGDVEALSDPSA